MNFTFLKSSKTLFIVCLMCLNGAFTNAQNADANSKESYKDELNIKREVKVKQEHAKKNELIERSNSSSLPNGYKKSTRQNDIKKTVPSDFPRFIDTGNPSSDSADYERRKNIWIQNNPDRYNKSGSGSIESKSISTKSN